MRNNEKHWQAQAMAMAGAGAGARLKLRGAMGNWGSNGKHWH